MTTTRLYLSTDGGAPVVAGGSTGSLVAALHACLVTGYGSKDPAGWSRPFVSGSVMALQNSAADGGTGAVFRLADDVTTGVRQMTILGYASMSDINNGSAPTEEVMTFRAPTSSTATLDWMVVADELTCYATLQVPSAQRMVFFGFGDADSLAAGDGYRYFVMGHTQTNANFAPNFLTSSLLNNGSFGGTSAGSGLSFGRDYTGTGSAAGHGLIMPNFRNGQLGGGDFPARPSANSADEAALPAYAIRDNVIRARLRGLYVPLSDLSGLDAGAAKSGDGFGGSGSIVRALRNANLTNAVAGMWVETALPWS